MTLTPTADPGAPPTPAAEPSPGGGSVRPDGRLQRIVGGLLVVAVAVAVYAASGVRPRADSRLSTLVALSAVYDRDLRLDEYADVVDDVQPYLRDTVDGHLVSAYPVATPLLVAPFVVVADVIERATGGESLRQAAAEEIPEDTEFHVAVAVSALSVLAMYGVALALGLRARWAVVFALGFALCTSMWSVASRGLWAQNTSMLGFALLLLLAVTRTGLERTGLDQTGTAARVGVTAKDRWWGVALGAVVAALVMIRTTHAVVLLPLLVLRRRSVARIAGPAVAGLAAVGIPLLLATQLTYGTPFPRYNGMTVADIVHDLDPAGVPNALAAILVSPNRGLFAFTPVLLLALPVVVSAARRRRRVGTGAGSHPGDPIVLACAGSFVAVSAVYALWPVYWGGLSYGPRLMSDAVPFLWLPLAFLGGSGARAAGRGRWPRAAALGTVGVLALGSAAAHGRGALSWAPYAWNVQPRNVDEYPGRVWAVRDLQVLRGVDLPGAGWFQAEPCRSVPVPAERATAVRARRDPSQAATVRVPPGRVVWLRVQARNDAGVALRSCGDAPTFVSYHLLDGSGRMLRFDGTRRPLPRTVRSGSSASTSLDIAVPMTPGRYLVRLALVQEGLRWFDVPADDPAAVVEVVVG